MSDRVELLKDRNSIYLQGVGRLPAVPASTLQVGDVLTCNYSPDATQVTKILKETAHTLVIEETPIVLLEKPVLVEKSYIRHLPKDCLVATRKAREEWKLFLRKGD